VKVRDTWYSAASWGNVITEALRYGTHCKGSHSVTCTPTRLSTNGMNHSCLAEAGSRGMEAESTQLAGCIPRWCTVRRWSPVQVLTGSDVDLTNMLTTALCDQTNKCCVRQSAAVGCVCVVCACVCVCGLWCVVRSYIQRGKVSRLSVMSWMWCWRNVVRTILSTRWKLCSALRQYYSLATSIVSETSRTSYCCFCHPLVSSKCRCVDLGGWWKLWKKPALFAAWQYGR